MSRPDQRLFDADIAGAEFRSGAAKRLWGLAAPTEWPFAYFWLSAAPRPNAPDRYSVKLDMTGYRSVSPTGCFWDPDTKAHLDFAKYPKGKPNTRFARVFRIDWGHSNVAFYHPYDRLAMQTHADWAQALPHLAWTAQRTIVDWLEEFQTLLNSEDYVGA